MKNLKLDKSTWKLTKLGDLAKEISKRVDDPAQSNIDRFVGLQHFVSGDLKIKNWGETKSLTSSTKAFKKGDILFARRNAYLRRASLVEFNGVCSGDAFVLRENDSKVIPCFLAFVVNSNSLWDFANSNAAGTMSKRVKWRDLAEYEFLLPPKDQQAQLAKLLWAMDEVIEKELVVLEKFEVFKASHLKDLFSGKIRIKNIKSKFIQSSLGLIPIEWKIKKVEDIAKVIRGASPRPKGDSRYYGGKVPRLMGEDVTRDGKYVTPQIDSLTEDGAKLSRPMKKGTLVMICSGNVGLSSILAVDCCIHDGFIAFSELNKECNLDFLYYTFNSQLHRLFQNATHGGVFTNLTTEIIKNFEIVIPPKEEQDFIGIEVSSLDQRIEVVGNKLNSSKSLQKSLINQIF
jgi:type I restriction enzyme, S subunit